MSRAADPIRFETPSATPTGGATPSRRLCPFCGTVNDVDGASALTCTRCGMEDTPATRQATRARIGPWHVLQSRNPAAPGMKFSTLVSLIRKGQVTARSIVRGPTTSQFWTVAARVKGLSREFGVCYHCAGEIENNANICTHCQKLQEPPINPDVLLEFVAGESSGSSASTTAAPARRPRPYVPEPMVNVDLEPTKASAPRTAASPPGGILTAKELATAFQLDFQPHPEAPRRKRHRLAKTLLTLIVLAGIAAGVGSYWRPDLRDQSVEWVRRYSEQLKARFERQWNQEHSTDSPAEEFPSAQSASGTIEGLMAAPEAPPARLPTEGVQPPPIQDKADRTTGIAEKASDMQPATPAPVSPAPAARQSAAPVPSPSPALGSAPERTISEVEMLNQVRSLWRAAIDAEADQDFAKAVRIYEQIRNLPRNVWPLDLDVRLNAARKHVR